MQVCPLAGRAWLVFLALTPTWHHDGLVWQGPLSPLPVPCAWSLRPPPPPTQWPQRMLSLAPASLPSSGGSSAEPPSGCRDDLDTRQLIRNNQDSIYFKTEALLGRFSRSLRGGGGGRGRESRCVSRWGGEWEREGRARWEAPAPYTPVTGCRDQTASFAL